MNEAQSSRSLTSEERHLVHWMIERGEPDAGQFIRQLEKAQVLSVRCPCGCASIDFKIAGQANPSGPLRTIAHFIFGEDADLSGIFVFEQAGVLAGLEVYGLVGDAPKTLPAPELLRPFSGATTTDV